MANKAKIQEAIEYLNRANAAQQQADIVSDDEEDVCYEVHNAIENVINTLEEFLD